MALNSAYFLNVFHLFKISDRLDRFGCRKIIPCKSKSGLVRWRHRPTFMAIGNLEIRSRSELDDGCRTGGPLHIGLECPAGVWVLTAEAGGVERFQGIGSVLNGLSSEMCNFMQLHVSCRSSYYLLCPGVWLTRSPSQHYPPGDVHRIKLGSSLPLQESP